MIADDGCWADYRADSVATRGKLCLFLDRDGVLIEDSGYPHDPALITFIPETLELVREANTRGVVVGIVSNQSGIGRGYFDWTAFAAVQNAIDAALGARGAHLDFVLACPHVAEATVEGYRRDDHPWRKPAPGMILSAANTLGLAMTGSAMVGDRVSDMVAAAQAGLTHRALLLYDEHSAAQDSLFECVSRDALSEWFRKHVAPNLVQR